MPDSPLSQQPELIGRAEELEQIARVRRGGAIGVVIEGRTGVGKSRLAREAVAAAGSRAARVEWVQATRSAAILPLGAFAELAPATGGIVDALRERAAGRAIVLGVDDALLLDEESAALVLRLATEGIAFVVVTLRAGAPRPAAIDALWDDERVMRLPLAELNGAETNELAEAWLQGPMEVAALDWAYESSRGNARYLQELLRAAVADEALVRSGGLWRLTHLPLPSPELVELVASDMPQIGEDDRRALELLALGEPLEQAEAELIVGARSLATLVDRGLVTTTLGVRVAHPLHADVLRAEMPRSRAREARLRLAELLQERDPFTPDDALRVARWLVDAGELVPTATLLDAARAAIHLGDPPLGASYAEAAVAGGAGLTASLVQARALILSNRFEEAERVLAPLEGELTSQDAAIEYLDQRVTALYWGLTRADDALELVRRAHDWWPDPTWHQRLEPLNALASGFGGSLAMTAGLVDAAGIDDEIRHRLEPLHAANLFSSGRAKEAYALALAIRPSIPIRSRRDGLALVVWSLVASETGEDWKELDAWLWSSFATALRTGDEGSAGITGLMVAALRFQQTRFHDASRSLDEAQRHLERHDAFGLRILLLVLRVGVALHTGDEDGAVRWLARCHEAVGEGEALATQEPYMLRAEAWAARAAGDPFRAQRLLLEAAASPDAGPGYAARAAYEAMLAGAPGRRVAPLLAGLAERCDSRLVAAFTEHAAALAADDGRALLTCTDTFEAIGSTRYAIQCVAHAAEAFARAGRQDSARRAAARCFDMLIPEQGGFAPTIVGLDNQTEVLTARESQLVSLVARGLSNGEIAEQLALSVRTVESHVYRAMRKLGVDDRRELAARRSTPERG